MVTLTFLRLGKIAAWDAVFYIAAQFIGGLVGVWLVVVALGARFAHPPVACVATVPGERGIAVAFVAEAAISCGLMLMVLLASNHVRLARYTGVFAGLLVAAFILVEAPYSAMSMNPARTIASALPGSVYTAWWIYFIAPIVGMFTSVEAYRVIAHGKKVHCAKLCHHTHRRCIFNCHHAELMSGGTPNHVTAVLGPTTETV